MTSVSPSKLNPRPALLIFKRTPNGRYRAAWFSTHEATACGKAARSMGYTVLPLTDQAGQQQAASQLPPGALSNGGLNVPFVKGECLKQVLSVVAPVQTKTVGVPSDPPADSKPVRGHSKAGEPVLIDVSPNLTPTVPNSWAEIQPGSEVLVRDQHDEAWYEAVVLSVAGDICQLKWRDYPGYPVLSRQRHHLALMHPAKNKDG